MFNELFVENIQKSKIWLCDGTFKSCPVNFYQVFIIHCSIYDSFLPMVYFFLPDKQEKTYFNALIELKKIN